MTTRSLRRRALSRVGRAALLATSALLFAACADNSTKEQNPLEPKGGVAERQIGLLEFWMIPAGIIGLGVLVATVYVALRFRERPGNENPKQIHGNSVLELGWTIVPALIMAAMAVPTVALIWDLDAKPDDPLEITVYGKQWWWEYQYTNLDLMDPTIDYQVNTANELHIPSGRPVWFTLKSDNVIHSFWVPSLAGKKDVVPGRDNTMWFEADTDDEGKWFYGQCAEFCGLSHADMRIKVFVHSPADFLEWARNQHEPWSEDRVARAAELEITGTWGCTTCHYLGGTDAASDQAIADGTGANIRPGPNLTHLGGAAPMVGRTTFAGAKHDLYDEDGNLDTDKLAQWILHAPELKPAQCDKPFAESGERCKGMPNFEKSGMTLADATKIAEFLLESEQ